MYIRCIFIYFIKIFFVFIQIISQILSAECTEFNHNIDIKINNNLYYHEILLGRGFEYKRYGLTNCYISIISLVHARNNHCYKESFVSLVVNKLTTSVGAITVDNINSYLLSNKIKISKYVNILFDFSNRKILGKFYLIWSIGIEYVVCNKDRLYTDILNLSEAVNIFSINDSCISDDCLELNNESNCLNVINDQCQINIGNLGEDNEEIYLYEIKLQEEQSQNGNNQFQDNINKKHDKFYKTIKNIIYGFVDNIFTFREPSYSLGIIVRFFVNKIFIKNKIETLEIIERIFYFRNTKNNSDILYKGGVETSVSTEINENEDIKFINKGRKCCLERCIEKIFISSSYFLQGYYRENITSNEIKKATGRIIYSSFQRIKRCIFKNNYNALFLSLFFTKSLCSYKLSKFSDLVSRDGLIENSKFKSVINTISILLINNNSNYYFYQCLGNIVALCVKKSQEMIIKLFNIDGLYKSELTKRPVFIIKKLYKKGSINKYQLEIINNTNICTHNESLTSHDDHIIRKYEKKRAVLISNENKIKVFLFSIFYSLNGKNLENILNGNLKK